MSVMHRVAQRPGGHDPDFIFWCPGCRFGHGVWVTTTCEKTGARWTWNGSMEKPTFGPSILVTGTNFTEAGLADYDAWMKAGAPDRQGKVFDSVDWRCHSHVINGQIHYCSDSTHKLAGQIVDMPDVDALCVEPQAGSN